MLYCSGFWYYEHKRWDQLSWLLHILYTVRDEYILLLVFRCRLCTQNWLKTYLRRSHLEEDYYTFGGNYVFGPFKENQGVLENSIIGPFFCQSKWYLDIFRDRDMMLFMISQYVLSIPHLTIRFTQCHRRLFLEQARWLWRWLCIVRNSYIMQWHFSYPAWYSNRVGHHI